jgi:hypothetical protein
VEKSKPNEKEVKGCRKRKVTGSSEAANRTYGSKNKDNINLKAIHPRCVSGNKIKHQTAICQIQYTFFYRLYICFFIVTSEI